MTTRQPGEGRYSHLEREQRWQLRAVPPNVKNERLIIDHYVQNTTLRLRMVEEPDGAIYKMTQKIRVVADEPEKVRITNVYLSANEFDLLCILPSTVVSKRRWTVVAGDLEFAVDVFRGRHEGLVLAERELGDDEDRVTIPDFADLEVTNDNDYSGGSLSSASDDEIHRLISAVSDVRRGA